MAYTYLLPYNNGSRHGKFHRNGDNIGDARWHLMQIVLWFFLRGGGG